MQGEDGQGERNRPPRQSLLKIIKNIQMSSQPVTLTSTEPQPRTAELYAQNKNVIACWLLLITELFYAFMYGFFVRINQVQIAKSEDFVHTALLFVLIVGGFGLALAKSYQLVWSSLGFNIIITALSIQTFFLVNAFWTKAAVFFAGSYFNTSTYRIYLSPDEITTETHATLNEALKCSLACIVAFSFVIGRAGLLQLYGLTIAGTIVYELARETCLNNFPYEIGSIKIFLYGGVLGLMASLALSKFGQQANTINHYNNITNRPTTIISLLGCLVCWALFPLLTREVTISQTVTTTWARVFTVVLAMSSAGLLGVFLGTLNYGFRMVLYSVIGAGVAILSASAYISNPVYGIVFGLSSSLFQFLFLFVNTKLKKRIGPLDPHAYVFVGQGFLGIFYEAINRQIVQTNPNSLVFDWYKNARRPEYILGNGAITIGMALLLGLFMGILFACCRYHEEMDHFTDFTYWERGDGISVTKKLEPVPVLTKQQSLQLYVQQNNQKIKQKNAYL